MNVQGGGTILDVKGGEGSWKLDYFHGRHIFIIPYCNVTVNVKLFSTVIRVCIYQLKFKAKSREIPTTF